METKKMPYFRLFAQDFLVSTAAMTDTEVGAYMRLLCHQWVNYGIPSDPARIELLLSTRGEDFLSIWKTLKGKFPDKEDGKLFNPRLEEIRDDLAKYKEQKSKAGKAGANKRWAKVEDPGPVEEDAPPDPEISIKIDGEEATIASTIAMAPPLPEESQIINSDVDKPVDNVNSVAINTATNETKAIQKSKVKNKEEKANTKVKSQRSNPFLDNVEEKDSSTVPTMKWSECKACGNKISPDSIAAEMCPHCHMNPAPKLPDFLEEVKAIYTSWFVNQNGFVYQWAAKDNKALGGMIAKIKKLAKSQGREPTSEIVKGNLKIMLERLPKWYLENDHSLSTLNGKFNSILTNIQSNGNNATSATQAVAADIAARTAQ